MLFLRARKARSSDCNEARVLFGAREGRKARWLVGFGALLRRFGWWVEVSGPDCCGEEERYKWEEPNHSSWDW